MWKKIFGLHKPKKNKRKSNANSQNSTAIGPIASTSQVSEGSSTTNVDNIGPTTFLPNARDFHIENLNSYHVDNRGAILSPGTESSVGWDILLKKAAPNALYDSHACFDMPKCDTDTRVEVTTEIMNWVQDRSPEATNQPLLCITGAAGAGKSAIQQTIAERCAGLGILAASFFFWAGDSTRNTAEPFVATIAYQLALASPIFRKSLIEVVETNPLIFTKSLQKQMNILIVEPIRQNRSRLHTLPHTILIDGLDECNGEQGQAELLAAIHECLLAEDLPFRVLVASRPELPIHTALAINGHLHRVAYHIQLSDQYDASADIERYLWRRLRDIARRSRDSRVRDGNWPGEEIIKLLVENASGQFIYAATVVKYLSDPRSSPVDRLQIIVSWTPGEMQKVKPFAALDNLYRQVLTIARDNYRNVDGNEDDFIVLLRISVHIGSLCGVNVWNLPDILGLADGSFDTLVSDVRSLVNVGVNKGPHPEVRFYHKSCSDFIQNQSRAGDLFETIPDIFSHMSRLCFQHIDRIALVQEKRLPGPSPTAESGLTNAYRSSIWLLPHIFVNQYLRVSGVIADIQRYTDLDLWLSSVAHCEEAYAHLKKTLDFLTGNGKVDLASSMMAKLRPHFENECNLEIKETRVRSIIRVLVREWYPGDLEEKLFKGTLSDPATLFLNNTELGSKYMKPCILSPMQPGDTLKESQATLGGVMRRSLEGRSSS